METKYYPSRIVMLQDLATRVKGLDVNKSAYLTKFSFVTEAGKNYTCPTALEFVKAFNGEFGEILDLHHTRTAGGRGKAILTYLDIPLEAAKEPELELKFDLAYATSLQEEKSKKEAKNALEAYGRKFNIELAKNRSFETMLSNLQDALIG